MKKILFILGLLFITSSVSAIGNSAIYKGSDVLWNTVTVSSHTTTALISAANALKGFDWLIVNTGSYDVYIASFAAMDTTVDTTDNAVTESFKLSAGTSISVSGKNTKPVFARIVAASANTCAVSVAIWYKD